MRSLPRGSLAVVGLLMAALLMASPPATGLSTETSSSAVSRAQPVSIVVRWNAAVLQAIRQSSLGPPMVARALAVIHTCMYDAWAAYDRVAVGTRYGAALRRPPRERSLRNIREAVSFAAYRAAVDLFPGSRASIFDPLMGRLGFDPDDTTTKLDSPAGVGNLACRAVLDVRHRDGANQLGDEPRGAPGVPHSDYTGYRPANDPMDLSRPFDPATVRDPSRWQPLHYRNAAGATVTPPYVAPFWDRVLPFAMPTGSALRSSTGPALPGTALFRKQALALLEISARLTDEQKMIAEYWADGPGTELPPGHWNLFAQYVSRRDHHGTGRRGIAKDVTLFFALNNALLDASIVAWDNKRAFDSVRPITALRYLFHGELVAAWAGPYQGTRLIDGGTWLPYQQPTFPTPPFPEYASGHSNFSAAAAEVLRRATGSDWFGASVTLRAGSSKVEPGAVPARDVTLTWDTFTDAADEAGLSRRFGGIHFEQGDVDARGTGRTCGKAAWELAQRHINGTAPTNHSPAREGPVTTPMR